MSWKLGYIFLFSRIGKPISSARIESWKKKMRGRSRAKLTEARVPDNERLS